MSQFYQVFTRIRLHASMVLILMTFMVFPVLSGCADSIDSLLYSALQSKEKHSEITVTKIISDKSPYTIKFDSRLGILKYTAKKPPRLDLMTITKGRFRNWSWNVEGTKSVYLSWQSWLKNHSSLNNSKGHINKNAALLTWSAGFHRLWFVSRYLMARRPPAEKLTIILVPYKTPYNLRETLTNASRVPITIASWYPVGQSKNGSSEQDKFRAYARALGEIGVINERFELDTGKLGAPTSTNAKVVKGRANEACWGMSSRAAISGGTNYRVKDFIPASKSSVVRIMAQIYNHHPNSLPTQEAYSAALVGNELRRYYSDLGLTPPNTGKDTRAINALLGFCRYFVRYKHDIRRQPPTFDEVHTAGLLPWVSHAGLRLSH